MTVSAVNQNPLCVYSVLFPQNNIDFYLICEPWPLQNQFTCVISGFSAFKRGNTCCESSTKSIRNYLASLSHAVILFDRNGLGEVATASRPGAHLEKPETQSETSTFTPCTNCKHPRLASIYLRTNSCHQGLTRMHRLGSVWLGTISLNSRNIAEKQTSQHLPYGARRGTTANHNQS